MIHRRALPTVNSRPVRGRIVRPQTPRELDNMTPLSPSTSRRSTPERDYRFGSRYRRTEQPISPNPKSISPSSTYGADPFTPSLTLGRSAVILGKAIWTKFEVLRYPSSYVSYSRIQGVPSALALLMPEDNIDPLFPIGPAYLSNRKQTTELRDDSCSPSYVVPFLHHRPETQSL